MQPSLTSHVDALEFARGEELLEGEFAVTDLLRLAATVVKTDARLVFSLASLGILAGKPAMRLKVEGVLTMTCQRCLEDMRFRMAIDKKLRLARTEQELAADTADLEDDKADLILGNKQMNIAELIEDEVLLAMPFAPRHAHCGATEDATEEAVKDKVSAKVSPFAVLAGLKTRQ